MEQPHYKRMENTEENEAIIGPCAQECASGCCAVVLISHPLFHLFSSFFSVLDAVGSDGVGGCGGGAAAETINAFKDPLVGRSSIRRHACFRRKTELQMGMCRKRDAACLPAGRPAGRLLGKRKEEASRLCSVPRFLTSISSVQELSFSQAGREGTTARKATSCGTAAS